MRKRIDHYPSVVPEKSQPSGPPPVGNASLPTGTVGPRVGIFLSPLNTNDGSYLSRIILPVPTLRKDKKRAVARRQYASRKSIRDVIVLLK